ncbi:hypothetical protein HOY80DRAFT_1012642 [Tuber brumale]|nr:hypothetical protein HOY80DRAFT_1012642 [Tuber brumale]
MVSPMGSACNVQDSLKAPTSQQTLSTMPSIDSPATPVMPPPPLPCCGVSPGLGGMSGVQEVGSTYAEGEKPLIGPGIGMQCAAYGERSLLLTNPLTLPFPPPKKRKERPPPVLAARHLQRRYSWKFEKNCDTRPGAIFAPPHAQNMSGDRPIFENLREHCGRHGEDWATATPLGSNKDSCATLVASMHSENELQSEGKRHLGGASCALKHCRRNKRCVAWAVDGLAAALT